MMVELLVLFFGLSPVVLLALVVAAAAPWLLRNTFSRAEARFAGVGTRMTWFSTYFYTFAHARQPRPLDI
jgi:hypothetical protein